MSWIDSVFSRAVVDVDLPIPIGLLPNHVCPSTAAELEASALDAHADAVFEAERMATQAELDDARSEWMSRPPPPGGAVLVRAPRTEERTNHPKHDRFTYHRMRDGRWTLQSEGGISFLGATQDEARRYLADWLTREWEGSLSFRGVKAPPAKLVADFEAYRRQLLARRDLPSGVELSRVPDVRTDLTPEQMRESNRRHVEAVLDDPPSAALDGFGRRRGEAWDRWTRQIAATLDRANNRPDPLAITVWPDGTSAACFGWPVCSCVEKHTGKCPAPEPRK